MIEEYQSVRKAVNAAASSARLLAILFVALCLSGFDRPDSSREEIHLQTKEGDRLSAYFYRPDTPGAEGALLIHGEGGSKEMFSVLAGQMRDQGVATLVLDLPANLQDLETAFERLRGELLPESSVLLAGLSEGASLAAAAVTRIEDEDVWPALCLIRPGPDVILTLGAGGSAVPAVVLVGREDVAGREVARELYRTGEVSRDVWQLDGGRGISDTMLQRDDFCADLTEWFVAVSTEHRDERRRDEATSSNERP